MFNIDVTEGVRNLIPFGSQAVVYPSPKSFSSKQKTKTPGFQAVYLGPGPLTSTVSTFLMPSGKVESYRRFTILQSPSGSGNDTHLHEFEPSKNMPLFEGTAEMIACDKGDVKKQLEKIRK